MPVAEEKETKNAALLKRIRQRYRYGMDKWRKIREEGQKNIRYVSGDPWEDEDKRARKGRPTVCADELNQYVNQVVNMARQNPRGIVIDPAGGDATEQMAEYREDRIRAIEYACNASRAYINGLQGAVERNIGYWKVSRIYVAEDSPEQEIVVIPVMNPDSVLIDPDYKELDASDIKWAFELDRMPLDDFEAEYPEAEKRSFSGEDFGGDADLWFDGKSILTASYWETRPNPASKRGARTIHQYITNGIEILKEGPQQPGPYIPIIPCFGKELWVDEGAGPERVLNSLVSLGRDPQKALAFVMSAMLENVGQLPKTTFVGWKGQFETDAEAWATLNSVFHPTVQLDPGDVLDGNGQPLQPLGWAKTTPDFQAYSVGADLCRRAIQAAMGVSPLPTAAQRQNQKSGVALEKIQSEQAVGSYHLVDNYDSAIKLTGRIINHWLSEIDLGQTQRPVRSADGTHKLVHINTDEAVRDESGHEYHFPIADDQGRYQVTVSSGPSHESQREEASEFISTVAQNIKNWPLSPQQAQGVIGLMIKLKQLGPLGDQMAELINPPGQGQMQNQMAQLQMTAAAMKEQLDKTQALVQKLMLEREGKVIEGQFKMATQKMQEDTKLAVAQMNASKDANESIAQREIDTFEMLHDSAHELAMQAGQQQHEQQMAQVQHQQALEQGQQAAANASMQSAQDAAQSQAAQPAE